MLGSKNFLVITKILGSKENLVLRAIWVQKKFVLKKFLVQQFLERKKIDGLKKFRVRKKFRLKNFWVKKKI